MSLLVTDSSHEANMSGSAEIPRFYYKAGFDWNDYLTQASGSVTNALKLWADQHEAFVKHIRQIASFLEGKDVTGYGDAYLALIEGLSHHDCNALIQAGLLEPHIMNDLEDNDEALDSELLSQIDSKDIADDVD